MTHSPDPSPISTPSTWVTGTGSKSRRVTEWRDRGGYLHREDGPARVEESVRTGEVLTENYYRSGVRHRDGSGPAIVAYDRGLIRSESFYRWGSLGGGPNGEIAIHYYRTGVVKSRAFAPAGRGPATIAYDPTGAREPSRDAWKVGDWNFRTPSVPAAVAALTTADAVQWVGSKSYFAEFRDHGLSNEAIAEALRAGILARKNLLEVANGAPVEWVLSFQGGRAESNTNLGWDGDYSGFVE